MQPTNSALHQTEGDRMFWAIVGVLVAIALLIGVIHDRRRRRRGAGQGTINDGPGTHGAYAEGLHEGMRHGTTNWPGGGY